MSKLWTVVGALVLSGISALSAQAHEPACPARPDLDCQREIDKRTAEYQKIDLNAFELAKKKVPLFYRVISHIHGRYKDKVQEIFGKDRVNKTQRLIKYIKEYERVLGVGTSTDTAWDLSDYSSLDLKREYEEELKEEMSKKERKTIERLVELSTLIRDEMRNMGLLDIMADLQKLSNDTLECLDGDTKVTDDEDGRVSCKKELPKNNIVFSFTVTQDRHLLLDSEARASVSYDKDPCSASERDPGELSVRNEAIFQKFDFTTSREIPNSEDSSEFYLRVYKIYLKEQLPQQCVKTIDKIQSPPPRKTGSSSVPTSSGSPMSGASSGR